MTQIRIDARDLANELESALAHVAAGDEVLIERDGHVVAELTRPAAPRESGGLRAFFAERRDAEPLDPDWEKDLEEAGRWLNRPAEIPRWG